MTKHILTYGSIGGAIVLLFMLISQTFIVNVEGEPNFNLAETVGYISMIVSLSMIFIGTKSYRDKELAGQITFGHAFKIGLLITLVASAFYVIGWMIYYHTSESASQFMEKYTEFVLNQLAEKGATEDEILQTKQQYEEFGEMYENPFVMAGVTLLEIFPVGLVISLISSYFLRTNTNT